MTPSEADESPSIRFRLEEVEALLRAHSDRLDEHDRQMTLLNVSFSEIRRSVESLQNGMHRVLDTVTALSLSVGKVLRNTEALVEKSDSRRERRRQEVEGG